MAPVVIYVNGAELLGWTSMQLTRSKNDLTGTLDVQLFMGYVPTQPVQIHAARAAEILVYIGGQLSFCGIIDTRVGTRLEDDGVLVGDASISTTQYVVSLKARGKTKYLIDSSHEHPTTNIIKPKTKDAYQTLINPWNIELDWQAQDFELDRIRLRDGAMVVDELQRLAVENCYYMYETRDGRLRVCDAPLGVFGEDLILGDDHITSFSASQSEEKAKAKIKVKGQLTGKEKWGEEALLETEIEFEDSWVRSNIPIVVYHYGDGKKENLERRAKFEANRRNSDAKKVTVDVFHVQPKTAEAWDIGLLHYVEIPPEGIFNTMECTELTYSVDAEGTIKTSMTLSPPPTSQNSGTGLQALVGSPADVYATYSVNGQARAQQAGVTYAPGYYPDVWESSQLEQIRVEEAAVIPTALEILTDDGSNPPLTLSKQRLQSK